MPPKAPDPPIVRSAEFGDIMAISGLIEGVAGSRTTERIARNRANAMVKRARSPRKDGLCFVAEGRDGAVIGFIYAESIPAFEIVPKVPLMIVPFLVGRNCARPLLRRLRSATKKRILVTAWNMAGRHEALGRLLRSEGYRPAATVFNS